MYRRRIGSRIFNAPFGNTSKLLFWTELSKDQVLKRHLPYTAKYTNVKVVQHFLRKFKDVYIKPYAKAGGSGIVGIRYINKRNVFINEQGMRTTVQSTKHLIQLLNRNLRKKTAYIVQQSVPSDFSLGKIDFRAYVQKDGSGHWDLTGLETKIGKRGSIISNSKSRVGVLQGEKALEKIYGLSSEQVKRKIAEICTLGIRMLTIMEKHHHLLGDAAIDMVIDKNSKVWLLEVQFNYAAEIKQFRAEDERKVLPFILHKPFEYAQYLAGFSPISEIGHER